MVRGQTNTIVMFGMAAFVAFILFSMHQYYAEYGQSVSIRSETFKLGYEMEKGRKILEGERLYSLDKALLYTGLKICDGKELNLENLSYIPSIDGGIPYFRYGNQICIPTEEELENRIRENIESNLLGDASILDKEGLEYIKIDLENNVGYLGDTKITYLEGKDKFEVETNGQTFEYGWGESFPVLYKGFKFNVTPLYFENLKLDLDEIYPKIVTFDLTMNDLYKGYSSSFFSYNNVCYTVIAKQNQTTKEYYYSLYICQNTPYPDDESELTFVDNITKEDKSVYLGGDEFNIILFDYEKGTHLVLEKVNPINTGWAYCKDGIIINSRYSNTGWNFYVLSTDYCDGKYDSSINELLYGPLAKNDEIDIWGKTYVVDELDVNNGRYIILREKEKRELVLNSRVIPYEYEILNFNVPDVRIGEVGKFGNLDILFYSPLRNKYCVEKKIGRFKIKQCGTLLFKFNDKIFPTLFAYARSFVEDNWMPNFLDHELRDKLDLVNAKTLQYVYNGKVYPQKDWIGTLLTHLYIDIPECAYDITDFGLEIVNCGKDDTCKQECINNANKGIKEEFLRMFESVSPSILYQKTGFYWSIRINKINITVRNLCNNEEFNTFYQANSTLNADFEKKVGLPKQIQFAENYSVIIKGDPQNCLCVDNNPEIEGYCTGTEYCDCGITNFYKDVYYYENGELKKDEVQVTERLTCTGFGACCPAGYETEVKTKDGEIKKCCKYLYSKYYDYYECYEKNGTKNVYEVEPSVSVGAQI